jgi:hypothetical protein
MAPTFVEELDQDRLRFLPLCGGHARNGCKLLIVIRQSAGRPMMKQQQ